VTYKKNENRTPKKNDKVFKLKRRKEPSSSKKRRDLRRGEENEINFYIERNLFLKLFLHSYILKDV